MRFLQLALRARHEPTDAQGGGRISQYLQHCTTKRTDAKDWAVTTMVEDIEPLLAEVEKHLGAHSFILPPVTVKTLDQFSASTTTGTLTSAAAVVAGEWLRGADFADDRAAKVRCVSLSERTW